MRKGPPGAPSFVSPFVRDSPRQCWTYQQTAPERRFGVLTLCGYRLIGGFKRCIK